MGNENQEEKIFYLCDGYGCDAKCELNGECKKTSDINHAKNFVKRNDHFAEKEEVQEDTGHINEEGTTGLKLSDLP